MYSKKEVQIAMTITAILGTVLGYYVRMLVVMLGV